MEFAKGLPRQDVIVSVVGGNHTHANAAYGVLALQKIHDELRLLGPPL